MIFRIIDKLIEIAVDLLFPRRCPICGDIVVPRGYLICPKCRKELEFVEEPLCKKCGKEIESMEMEYCYDCLKSKHTYNSGWALLNYTDLMKKSVSHFKYHNKREYADWYVEELLRKYKRNMLRVDPDAIIPIPLHHKKRKKRGFNQAEILAKGLSLGTGIPMRADILFRNRNTIAQKNLNNKERLRNLEQAFVIKKESARELETVILVDDIYTTGSTIEACTRVLKKAGIKEVYFISLCIGKGF